ncbi:AMP-binding protein [Neobacillus sp. D3-1R]|uniref:AMP-binding protein n=1 Tax=Neobacillus sp. D3-1R TaxID=3445778 RepID=UPI003FA0989B
MKIIKLIYVLFKMRLLSPIGIFKLSSAIFSSGINLLTLLSFASKIYPDNTALVDENETFTYHQLFTFCEKLSMNLSQNYKVKNGEKVAFLCKNHASLVQSIFAFSRLGADLYLLNAEMSREQFKSLLAQHDFDYLVYDYEITSMIELTDYNKVKILSYHSTLPAINNLLLSIADDKIRLWRNSTSKLMLLTGGTTGESKRIAHKPSLIQYLNPFVSLLHKLRLLHYKTAYIATPIYHGYGIAILLLFIALGKKIVICKGFKAEKACHLIREHEVEVITVVPLMIHKMLKHNVNDLKPLACIASGGAKLNPKLVNEVFRQLGEVLYNLYGTTEAGLCMIATPKDLKYSPETLGKIIKGVLLHVLDDHKKKVPIGTVGQFCVKNSWIMKNKSWIKTGDLGYQDSKGYFFLCGRTDEMIVSAGENVYPNQLEHVFLYHPEIEEAAVIGVNDELFGQRLVAFVTLVNNSKLSKAELFEWLQQRVARFQVPKDIIFMEQMPYTSLGKLNKKLLKENINA